MSDLHFRRLRVPALAQQLPDLVVGFNRHSPLLQHGPGADGDPNDEQRHAQQRDRHDVVREEAKRRSDAGQELSEHTTPYDALAQVVEVEATITIAGRPYPLRAGDMIIMPAHQPHAVKAVSRFKMLLTMIRS